MNRDMRLTVYSQLYEHNMCILTRHTIFEGIESESHPYPAVTSGMSLYQNAYIRLTYNF